MKKNIFPFLVRDGADGPPLFHAARNLAPSSLAEEAGS